MPGRIKVVSPVPHEAGGYESTAGRKASRVFYKSNAWLRLSAYKRRSSPLCEDCLLRGRTVLADHVHHMQEVKDRPDLALDPSNLLSLCRACHNMRHKGARKTTPEIR